MNVRVRQYGHGAGLYLGRKQHDFRFTRLAYVWIHNGDRQVFVLDGSRALQSPERRGLAVAIVIRGRTGENRAHGLRALMRRVHLKDVIHRREQEMIAVRKEQTIQAVDELRTSGHGDFLGMAIKISDGGASLTA